MQSLLQAFRKVGRLEGFYRAKVVDNRDPERLGRVRVKVYPLMAGVKDSECPWAEPCWYGGVLYIPPVNSWVWVFFDGGDVARPVWFGQSLPFNDVRFIGGSVSSEFGKGLGEAGGMFDEVGAGYPESVVFRAYSRNWLVFYDDGAVELKSGNGSVLRMDVDGKIVLRSSNGSEVVINADGTMLIDAKGRRIDLNP